MRNPVRVDFPVARPPARPGRPAQLLGALAILAAVVSGGLPGASSATGDSRLTAAGRGIATSLTVAFPTDLTSERPSTVTVRILVHGSPGLGGHPQATLSATATTTTTPTSGTTSPTSATTTSPPSTTSPTSTTTTSPTNGLFAGAVLTIDRLGTDGHWQLLGSGSADRNGTFRTPVTVWRSITVRARFTGTALLAASRAVTVVGWARPLAAEVVLPAGGPSPTAPHPDGLPPRGAGAAATVQPVSDAIWSRMRGYSWHPGCLPRSTLRYVTVNYWGFDGYRYRGQLVVRAAVATRVVTAFSALYDRRFPIRLMVLPDWFGHSPNHVGANDYAQMAADNTSAFNCRYVVGKEAWHVLSPHATGMAIDINTWENPYSSRKGPRPDAWYLRNRPTGFSTLFYPRATQTTTFTHLGWQWGGSWSRGTDYQHFEMHSVPGTTSTARTPEETLAAAIDRAVDWSGE